VIGQHLALNSKPTETTMQTLRKERRYETLSYLPPLSDQQIAKQVQYILDQGYFPAIEFNETSEPTDYYWTMWKLPLFNAGSVQEVLQEVNECRNAYRDSYVRVVGFDNIKQCQVLSFIIHKPGGNNYRY
jgi:ribulose-bisphosphate carboxylase small chain